MKARPHPWPSYFLQNHGLQMRRGTVTMKFRMMMWGTWVLSTLVMATTHAQTVREACAPDIAKFCRDAPDPQSRKQCMMEHGSELSEGCRTAYQEAQRANGKPDSASTQGSVPSTDAVNSTAARTGLAVPDGGFDTVAARIAGRNFPSIFAPWGLAENLRQPDGRTVPLQASESPLSIRARHDFFFSDFPAMGLKVADGVQYVVLTPEFAPESIPVALNNRAKLLAMNPHMLIFASIQYFSARDTYLPLGSPFWLHDEKNERFQRNNTEYRSARINFANPEFQDKVAAYCAAVLKTGVFDGCMLDWWHDDDQMGSARVALIRKIRAAIPEKAILIGNVNGKLPERTVPYLNGIYMEGLGAFFFPDWRTAASNLIWAESHLRKPAITALEGWYGCPTPDCRSGDPAQLQQQGRADLGRMRFVTTLSLVFSNGYVLFSDPNPLPTPDHLHDWYPFWDKSLGKPTGPRANLDRPDLSGAYTRRYENGEVVFNPPSNRPVTVNFQTPMRSAASGQTGRAFTVAGGDGDLFLNGVAAEDVGNRTPR